MTVTCHTCGAHIALPRYETDEEREAARRRAYRRSSNKRYQEYVGLCEQYGVQKQNARWASHLRELRALGNGEREPSIVPCESCGKDADEYRAYWLERFSQDEIWELAAGLSMFEVSA